MFSRTNLSTELGLIQGCLKGDRLAQRHLYETYAAKFLVICRRYLKEEKSAEDLMIESFMKIFERLPQYQGKGSFEGWMKRIVVTQALMKLRTQKHVFQEINLENESEYPDQPYLLEHLEVEEILLLIQNLPEGYRTVFNLYAIEGYSHQEIGQLLGISEGTSKSQLNRARNTLKEKIFSQQAKENTTNG